MFLSSYDFLSNPIVASLLSAAIVAIMGYVWRQYSSSRARRKQAYSKLLQLVAEIERDNPVRAGSVIAHATGAPGPFPYRVHKKLTAEINELMRKQGRYLKPEARDLWNNRTVAMRHYGTGGGDDYEDVILDDFISHVKSM
jgi:hypothetical protein